MKRYEIQNYLPFRRQQRSKQESSCPLFYGDFALVNSRFEVLASRGVHMPEGKRVSLSGVGHRFLSMHLTDRTRSLRVTAPASGSSRGSCCRSA